jgi:hypothetical protein
MQADASAAMMAFFLCIPRNRYLSFQARTQLGFQGVDSEEQLKDEMHQLDCWSGPQFL